MPQPSLAAPLAEGMKRFKHKNLLGVIAQWAMVESVTELWHAVVGLRMNWAVSQLTATTPLCPG